MPAYTVSNWQQAIFLAFSNILTGMLGALPRLLSAFLLFIIGLVLAKWGKKITVKSLNLLRLSKLLKKSGFEKFLQKAEITQKVEDFIGELVRWLIILVFFVATVNVLGLTTVSQVLSGILAYLPRIISAVLILTGGVLLAGVVEGVVKGALAQVDLKTARLLAKIASYLVVIFTILTTINELGIAQSLINTIFIGFVAMLVIGFGLAIGLGAKDLVAKVLDDWYEQFKKEIKKR
ncbi:hypothetical protein KJ965_00530 [Patescibacteria group bacterium]|nr:hypothetical protein [Patescibacteria group bacterium]